MTFTQFFPPLFSFVFTLFGIFLALKLFPKLKLMDRPHEYGMTRSPIPYSGGVIFFVASALGALFFIKITPAIAAVLVAGFLITLVSFIDDRVRLSPWLRLGVQIFAGIIVVFSGVQIQLINTPFGGPLFLDTAAITIAGHTIWIFSALIIIAWLVVMMNVMNWLDGIPGLASGISTIAQLSLFILATRQFNIVDQSAVITLSSILAASTFAFLLFDFYPPKILMGDSGSMFLGFMLGTLSILAGGKLATALLIMGFPVLDAVWVVTRRVLHKKSPLHGDLSHFHHRLLDLGLSARKALFFNYILCAAFAAIALLLHTPLTKFFALLGVFALTIVVSAMVKVQER